MTSSNLQIGSGMSYASLKSKHYELENQSSNVRNQSDYSFLLHEYIVLNPNRHTELIDKYNKLIEERDKKFIKRREHKKCDGDLEGFKKRKNSDSKVKHEMSEQVPVIFEVGNIIDYDKLVKDLAPYGVDEDLIRKAHVNGLKQAVKSFNSMFDNFEIDEYFVHANEKGVPHVHASMLIDSVDKRNMPELNLGAILKKKYDEKIVTKAMSKFRLEVDSMTLNCVRDSFDLEIVSKLRENVSKGLLSLNDFNNSINVMSNYVSLERTQGDVYLNQKEYINHQQTIELKEKEDELNIRAKKIEENEAKMEHQERELNERESELKRKDMDVYMREFLAMDEERQRKNATIEMIKDWKQNGDSRGLVSYKELYPLMNESTQKLWDTLRFDESSVSETTRRLNQTSVESIESLFDRIDTKAISNLIIKATQKAVDVIKYLLNQKDTQSFKQAETYKKQLDTTKDFNDYY